MSNVENTPFPDRRMSWARAEVFSRYALLTGKHLHPTLIMDDGKMQMRAMNQLDELLVSEQPGASAQAYIDEMRAADTPEEVWSKAIEDLLDRRMYTAFWQGVPIMQATVRETTVEAKLKAGGDLRWQPKDFLAVSHWYYFRDEHNNQGALEIVDAMGLGMKLSDRTELLYLDLLSKDIVTKAAYVRADFARAVLSIDYAKNEETVKVVSPPGLQRNYREYGWIKHMTFAHNALSTLVVQVEDSTGEITDKEYIAIEGTKGLRYQRKLVHQRGKEVVTEMTEHLSVHPFLVLSWFPGSIGTDGTIIPPPATSGCSFHIQDGIAMYKENGTEYIGRVLAGENSGTQTLSIPLSGDMVLSALFTLGEPITMIRIHDRDTKPKSLSFDEQYKK